MTQAKKRMYSTSQLIWITVSLVFIFLSKLMAAPWGLTASGFQVLGTLIGALILWLSVSVDWTSLLVLFSLALVPDLGLNAVAAGGLGNNTVFYLILCFMISACLAQTGVARRLAIWFLTSKLSRKGPWFTMAMIFVSIFVLASGLSSTATLMIFLPILYEIFSELGFQKNQGDALPSVLVLGLVVCAQIAQASTPIAHTMTLIGMSTYTSYTGAVIEFGQYVIVCMPIAIISVVAWFLIVKFLWKPDVSRMRGLDYDAISAKLGPMTKEEKWSGVVYLTVVLLWLLPGVTKYIAPGLYTSVFSKIHQCYPPIVGIILLHHIRVDGKSVLAYKDAVKAVPWNTVIFMSAILMLGSAFSNTTIGLSPWLAETIGPLFSNISPTLFIIIMAAFAIVLTNFISNAVTIAVCFAIAMPLVVGGVFGDSINPMVIAILMTQGASFAFATPPATPPAAVAADSGWIDTGLMFKWGMIVAVAGIAITIIIGLPIANLVC